jgi:hypothetical protein
MGSNPSRFDKLEETSPNLASAAGIAAAASVSAQAEHRPAALFGAGFQGGIRVDGNRVMHDFQQRQVIQRIAVEPAFADIGPAFTARCQPFIQAADFAFLERGQTERAAGEFTVKLFRFGGDQKGHAKMRGDRGGDKAVGGGDDDANIVAMFVQ